MYDQEHGTAHTIAAQQRQGSHCDARLEQSKDFATGRWWKIPCMCSKERIGFCGSPLSGLKLSIHMNTANALLRRVKRNKEDPNVKILTIRPAPKVQPTSYFMKTSSAHLTRPTQCEPW